MGKVCTGQEEPSFGEGGSGRWHGFSLGAHLDSSTDLLCNSELVFSFP